MGNKYVLSKYLQNIGLFAAALLLCLLLVHNKGYAYSKPPIPTPHFHPSILAPGDSYNASDVVGQSDFTSTTCSSGLTGYCPSWASATAIDAVHHRLFMADYNNSRILIYQLNNQDKFTDASPHTPSYVLGQPDLSNNFYNSNCTTVNPATTCEPYGMSYDSINNRLFVEDSSNRVLVFDLSSGISNGMDASYVLGQPDFASDGNGLARNQFCNVYGGIALDQKGGFLYVNDGSCKRIMVFNVNPGTISNGMDASYVLGQPDFTTANGNQLTANSTNYPEYSGLSFDSVHKRLFVIDNSYNRVMVFDMSHGVSNNMDASYVLGQPDLITSNNGDCTINTFVYNEGIGYDPKNQELFIQDEECNRILVFDLSQGITNGMNASMVLGQPDFTSTNYSGASQSSINYPYDSNEDFDSTNNTFYFVDGYSNRTLLFRFVKISQDVLPNPSLNQAYSQTISTSNSQGTVSYTVSSGSLPAGLVLNSTTGLISGTPTQSGSYTFSITAKDDNGTVGYYKDTNSYTLTVAAKAPVTGFGINSHNPSFSILIFTISAIAISATGMFIRKLNKS
jgi:Putative Ig domain